MRETHLNDVSANVEYQGFMLDAKAEGIKGNSWGKENEIIGVLEEAKSTMAKRNEFVNFMSNDWKFSSNLSLMIKQQGSQLC